MLDGLLIKRGCESVGRAGNYVWIRRGIDEAPGHVATFSYVAEFETITINHAYMAMSHLYFSEKEVRAMMVELGFEGGLDLDP